MSRWQKWPGGEMPIPGDTIVNALKRSGIQLDGVQADTLKWEHASQDILEGADFVTNPTALDDVLGYQIAPEPKVYENDE